MISKCARIAASLLTALSLTVSIPGGLPAQSFSRSSSYNVADTYATTTPIKHLVVIFQENVSFDHYFATYPYAQNTTSGEPTFFAREDTPSVNNLLTAGLMGDNNNNTTKPFRLGRSQSVTCDQSHNYNTEQEAFDHGLMDNFPAAVGTGNATFGIIPSTLPTPSVFGVNGTPYAFPSTSAVLADAGMPLAPGQYYQTSGSGFQGYCYDAGKGTGVVMGYYDGNTVTALWNYAQHFAMSDNSYDTTFGPSAPGAINVVSGNTCCVIGEPSPNGKTPSFSGDIWGAGNGATQGALIGDGRPYNDDCVNSNSQLYTTKVLQMIPTGVPQNVGDLMGDKGFNPALPITWGWFIGGFKPTGTLTSGPEAGRAVCGSAGTGIAGFGAAPLPDNVTTVGDYIPHHEPFQYYASSQNLKHLAPTSTIGTTDQANHQYDLSLFYTALAQGNLPAVSYLKAPAYQDGHPGYSDPLDEQIFIVNTINAIMVSPEWKNTAIVIAYDDSDGWYDHQMDPVVTQSGGISGVTDDQLSAAGFCGLLNLPPNVSQPPPSGDAPQGRCGPGTRQPLMVISPWAKENYVDHSVTDQSSIVRFIEDNWKLPRLAGSNDAKAGTLNNMFDFNQEHYYPLFPSFPEGEPRALILNPNTGQLVNIR